MPQDPRLAEAFRRFDEANSADPNTEVVDGAVRPKELVYAERMSAWVERLNPAASGPLRLAARSQHIRRWQIPRNQFPMTRAGYLKWRTTLYRFHADQAEAILRDVGYDNATIERVRDLLQKKNLASDPETQLLEDAASLVFLEHHFADFARRPDMDEQKLIRILRKTWRKMSPKGRQAALILDLPPHARRLLHQALESAGV